MKSILLGADRIDTMPEEELRQYARINKLIAQNAILEYEDITKRFEEMYDRLEAKERLEQEEKGGAA